MSESPQVTVVIPAWKTTAFIAETIDSVLAQDYGRVEIIVVNDGCPDTENLERVLAPYRDRGEIQYCRQENRGLSGARNTGIRLASTPYVATVDSDDIWEPSFLSSVYSMMASDPEIVLVYAHPVYFGHKELEGKKGVDVFPVKEGNIATFRDFVTRQLFGSPTGIFRRQTALDIGLYTEELRSAEDLDFQLRMARAGKVGYVREPPLYRCRIRPGSLTTSPTMGLWRIRAIERQLGAKDLTAEEVDMLQKEIAYLKRGYDFQEARYQFVYGNQAQGLKLMRDANRAEPSGRNSLILTLCRAFPSVMRAVARWRDRANTGTAKA